MLQPGLQCIVRWRVAIAQVSDPVVSCREPILLAAGFTCWRTICWWWHNGAVPSESLVDDFSDCWAPAATPSERRQPHSRTSPWSHRAIAAWLIYLHLSHSIHLHLHTSSSSSSSSRPSICMHASVRWNN